MPVVKGLITDQRIETFAKILVEHSLEVKPGETVLVQGTVDAKPLILALYCRLLLLGAHPWPHILFPETERIFYQHAQGNQLDYLSQCDIDILRKFDCLLFIRTETNAPFLRKIDPDRLSRRRLATAPALHAILNSRRWCAVLFPSPSLAQRTQLSLRNYRQVFFRAVNGDWPALQKRGKYISAYLRKVRSIRIEGSGTELELSVGGRKFLVGNGKNNMPDGEVFTAPLEQSARGRITFDIPVDYDGHVIERASLRFERGSVVEASARRGEKALQSILKIDEGSRRVGEFGIGINYDLDKPLRHIALDEKIGGTCHLALGCSIPGTGGKNYSAIHFDLIKDLRRDGRIIADGKTILERGQLQI